MLYNRRSNYPYTVSQRSQTEYPQEYVPEIIAHYQIQLQLEHKKLKDIQKSYKLKFQELEKKISQAQRQKKTLNQDKGYDQSLEREVRNKKKEIQYLTRKLQNLRKMPFNILNPIDQLLIPHESPYALIIAKKKEIKQLQNELAHSENIFEGNCIMEHKLINEYEAELALNKKLKLLRQEKQVIKEKSFEISRKKAKNTMINADYKKKSQQILKEIEQLKLRIKTLENQSAIQPIVSNQNYGSIQNLQIQRLQLQLREVTSQNEELSHQKKQKQSELKKLMDLNEKIAEQKILVSKTIDMIFGASQKLPDLAHQSFSKQQIQTEDAYTRTKRKSMQFNQEPSTSRGKILQQEQKIQKLQIKQEEESLLESVIKFFSRGTKATEGKSERQSKGVRISEYSEQSRSIPRYSKMVREESRNLQNFKSEPDEYFKPQQNIYTQRSNASREVLSNNEELRQPQKIQILEQKLKIHEKYISKIENQTILNELKPGTKYHKFNLEQIYKKQTKLNQDNPTKNSENPVTFQPN